MKKSGFSIVQVLVVSAMIGLLSVVMAQLFGSMNKSVKSVEMNSEIVGMVGEMRGILSDSVACRHSFLGKNASNSGTTIVAIKDAIGAGNVIFNKTSDYGVSKFRIKSFQLNDSDPTVNVVASNEGNTDLLVVFDRKGKTLSTTTVLKKIRLWVKVDAGKKIIDCRTASTGADSIWERNTSSPNKIFYNDGPVGIGTNDPLAKLDVDGAIKIAGDGWACNPTREGAVRYKVGSKKLQYCDGAGWVTVDDPDNCSASRIRATRYAIAAKKFQYCDGTNWQDVNSLRCQTCHLPDGLVWRCTNWLNLSTPGERKSQEFTDHGNTGKDSRIAFRCEDPAAPLPILEGTNRLP